MPWTCFRASSIFWMLCSFISSRVITVTLAGASSIFFSVRVGGHHHVVKLVRRIFSARRFPGHHQGHRKSAIKKKTIPTRAEKPALQSFAGLCAECFPMDDPWHLSPRQHTCKPVSLPLLWMTEFKSQAGGTCELSGHLIGYCMCWREPAVHTRESGRPSLPTAVVFPIKKATRHRPF